jgi:hypothetical protein
MRIIYDKLGENGKAIIILTEDIDVPGLLIQKFRRIYFTKDALEIIKKRF